MTGQFNSDFITKAETVIEKNISKFNESIRSLSEIGPFKKARKTTPGFPMFKPGNDEFYQYAYYEKSLEWYIRDFLVNAILRALFSISLVECLWPSTNRAIHVRFSNESIEDIYPFEFILARDETRTGYRHTGLASNEVEKLLNDYDLDRIIILDWTDETAEHFSNDVIGCNSDKVFSESAKHFFTAFFSDELYSIYTSKVRKAVENANEEIGFQTIPRLSLRYLSSFKSELTGELYRLDYKKLSYMVLDPENPKSAGFKDIILSEDDYKLLDSNFIEKRLYRALLGTDKFAKCFITAEYLYHIFREGNSFDYTSVVSGYLKSIEQLVYRIMQISLHKYAGEDYWIKGFYPRSKKDYSIMSRQNPVTNKPQVKFMPQNEEFFDITLAPLTWFLHDNYQYLVSEKEKIHQLLLRYGSECRNDHFHKDNIEAFRDVESIRNNTLLLMYMLIGGCRLSGSIEDDNRLLGITDDAFDRLYKRMIEIPRGVSKFCIKFAYKEEIIVRRMFNQDKPIYNDNGSVMSSSIKFITEEKYSTLEDETNVIPDVIIDRNNIPEKMWFIKYGGERGSIEW